MQPSKKHPSPKVTYITAIAVLAALAVAVTIVSQSRSNKKPQSDPATTPAVTTSAKKTTEKIPPVTTAPTTTAKFPETAETRPTAVEPVDAPPASFVAPAHGSLSKKHDTETLVYSLTMNDYRTHTGIDIVATVGSPVYAAADGIVGDIWEDPLMGRCMIVSHSGGMTTVYKNLSPDLPAGIEAGTVVNEGDIIAAVGETAMIESADEPHLHFEVILNGEYTDPLNYLPTLEKESYEN